MKTIKKDRLDASLGISCIENYILGFLNTTNQPAEYLYADSLCTFETLYNGYMQENDRDKDLQSLQEKVQKMGLFEFQYFDCVSIGELMKVLKDKKPNQMLAIKVDQPIQCWNEYILIEMDEKGFTYMNSKPAEEGFMDINQLENIFTGSYIHINQLRTINDKDKNASVAEFKNNLSKLKHVNENVLIQVEDEINLRKLSAFLDIYRIMVKRTEAFSKLFFNTTEMKELITKLDVNYSMIQYMRNKMVVVNAMNHISLDLVRINNDLLDILKNNSI